jgi:hypothetical protein
MLLLQIDIETRTETDILLVEGGVNTMLPELHSLVRVIEV